MSHDPRRALEDALRADFADEAAHGAYADLLLERGEARGEYLQMLAALHRPDLPYRERLTLEERAFRLWRDHERDWLGPLARFLLDDNPTPFDPLESNVDYAVDRGWVRRLRVIRMRSGLASLLAQAEMTRLVDDLTIERVDPGDRHPANAPLDGLGDGDALGGVRRLRVGVPLALRDAGLAAGVARMTRLEWFHAHLDGAHLAELFAALPGALREFALVAGSPVPLASLSANGRLAQLRILRLVERFDRAEDAADDPHEAASAAEFVAAPQLQGLEELELTKPGCGDALLEAVARGKRLPGLRTLNLAGTGVTERGLDALAGCRHLEQLTGLQLYGAPLSEEAVDAFRRARPEVTLETTPPFQYELGYGDEVMLGEDELPQ